MHFQKKILKGFSFALSELCCDLALSPTGRQCLLNCCNYKTRDITQQTIALSPKKTCRERKDWCWEMIEAGGAAAPRCYLSLASGWLATPPLLLSIARHRPSWRKHVMARYYSARDKTQRLFFAMKESDRRRFMVLRIMTAPSDGCCGGFGVICWPFFELPLLFSTLKTRVWTADTRESAGWSSRS